MKQNYSESITSFLQGFIRLEHSLKTCYHFQSQIHCHLHDHAVNNLVLNRGVNTILYSIHLKKIKNKNTSNSTI